MLLHTGKAYDASKVLVSSIPWGTIGKAVDFTVDASKAGEGNLEITISARGRNIPTQVHPQGSAKFMVSFVPLEGIDHIINITFNKELVPGAPFTAKIHTGMSIDNNELFDTANDFFLSYYHCRPQSYHCQWTRVGRNRSRKNVYVHIVKRYRVAGRH